MIRVVLDLYLESLHGIGVFEYTLLNGGGQQEQEQQTDWRVVAFNSWHDVRNAAFGGESMSAGPYVLLDGTDLRWEWMVGGGAYVSQVQEFQHISISLGFQGGQIISSVKVIVEECCLKNGTCVR